MTDPSTIARFLARHTLSDYAALCRRADEDPEWFWRAVTDFHGLHFLRPFNRLLSPRADACTPMARSGELVSRRVPASPLRRYHADSADPLFLTAN